MAAVRATAAELFANTSEKNSARVVVVAVIRALPLLFLLLIENADTRQLLVATFTAQRSNKSAIVELMFAPKFCSLAMIFDWCLRFFKRRRTSKKNDAVRYPSICEEVNWEWISSRATSALSTKRKVRTAGQFHQWVMSQKFECILSASNILALQVRRPPLIFRGLIGSSSEHKIGGNTAKLVSDTLNCARQK